MKQKKIKIINKGNEYTNITVKRYKSGEFSIHRKFSYRKGGDASFISPEEFKVMKEMEYSQKLSTKEKKR